ncbi:MAG: hypothetical protein J07HR59_00609 [Halorubrum sp. J07HR59]|nr:MAG: hypothetical protein J07HR59_00609 [Halorubrum sp. J07HR59]
MDTALPFKKCTERYRLRAGNACSVVQNVLIRVDEILRPYRSADTHRRSAGVEQRMHNTFPPAQLTSLEPHCGQR